MDNYRSANFRISLDETSPNTSLKSKSEDIRIRRISKQLIIISVLLMMIVSVIGFIGYQDIKKRLSLVQGTGSMEVKDLSMTLEARLTALVDKVSAHEKAMQDIDKSVNQKILPVEEIMMNFENNNVSINAAIKAQETAIAKIETAIREERQYTEKIIAEITANLSPLMTALKKNETDLAALEERLNREVTLLAEFMTTTQRDVEKPLQEIEILKTEISNIKKEVAAVSAGDIYKQVIDITLKRQQRYYEEKIDSLRSELEVINKGLVPLRKRLEALEQDMKAQKKLSTQDIKTIPPVTTDSGKLETDGGIIERDIQ